MNTKYLGDFVFYKGVSVVQEASVVENPLRPARSVDLRQIVYEKIKQAIVEGVVAPGEKLSEVDLAARLAVSRTPVREAIRQLAKTGLVTLSPRKGAFVTCPTGKDAHDLYALRENLEQFAVALLAQNPPCEELRAFRWIFEGMDSETDPKLYLLEDRKFHQFLHESTGNRFLTSVLTDLTDLINLYRPYSMALPDAIRTLALDHIKVIDALLAGDGVMACSLMSGHIQRNRMILEQSLVATETID